MRFVKMINKITGTEMYVEESRVSEYKAQGHRTTAPKLDDLKREEVDPGPVKELKKAIKRVSKKKV